MSDSPLVSIIIATLNAGEAIAATIRSIRHITIPKIELIIVDGGSVDSTMDIVNHAGDVVTTLIEEPDHGIYDAWNKGVRVSKGQYLAFLGAGDEYLPGGLETLLKCALANPEADYVSSKVALIKNGTAYRVVGSSWVWRKFRRHMYVAHPGMLHSRRLFEKYGQFDTSFKIAGDYEFLLRARDDLVTAYRDEVTVRMLGGGVSQLDRRVFQEAQLAKLKNNVVSPWIAAFDRYVGETKQRLRLALGLL